MAAIRKEKWYRPWMSMVAKSLEQCFDWGATNIILAGIKVGGESLTIVVSTASLNTLVL